MDNKEYAKVIANNLRRIMFDHNKTQADVSRDLQISKATLSSWMNGTRIPRMNNIDMLCHYFNVSRSDIMEEGVEKSQQHEYYFNPETAQIAQEIFDDPYLHALFKAARGSKPKSLELAADMLSELKGTNPDG